MPKTKEQLIRLGHSPDPDDAFMFYALAEDKIPSEGFRIEHVIEDIESLNQRALKKELEVTAVSCHAYAHLADYYVPMMSGSSIGDKYGPILVTKQVTSDTGQVRAEDIRGKKVAREADDGLASSPAFLERRDTGLHRLRQDFRSRRKRRGRLRINYS